MAIKRRSAYIEGVLEQQRRLELEAKSKEKEEEKVSNNTSGNSIQEELNSPTRKRVKESLKKTTLYFTKSQLDKFNNLIEEYEKYTNISLNRSDIAQIMVDRVSIKDLLPKLTQAEN